ncbi:gamma carbonic anhydrase family protein [Myxococcota bacterium]|nr:gamma carbonic anhydrase family protein [Myxococcota bacterium]
MQRNFGSRSPRIDPEAMLLEPCTVAGDVEIGPGTSVWFGAVIRGDVGAVRIGARSNIQDNCVLHESTGRTPLVIEDEVTVGHGAILHGCHLKRRCLVGMGAVVLDEAVVGEEAMVGAGALVPEGMVIPDRHLAVGVPAKVRRPLTDAEIAALKESADHYVEAAREYRNGMEG